MLARLLDRYIWAIDLLIIAVLATFVASGATQIASAFIDGRIQGTLEQKDGRPGAASRESRPPSFSPVDGRDILARNIFDSVTGPLLASKASTSAATQIPEEQPAAGLVPPRCEAALALKAAYASPGHPELSFVAIEQAGQTHILETGDSVAGYEIDQITWRFAILEGQEQGTCYLDVWDKSKPALPKHGAGKKGGKLDPKKLTGIINKSIRNVSPTVKDIDRSLVSLLGHNPNIVKKSGRLLPNVEGKKQNGFKIYGIRKTSIWGKLGLRNGDVLLSVNGSPIKATQHVNQMFGKLGSTNQASVQILRHGKPEQLTWNIK